MDFTNSTCFGIAACGAFHSPMIICTAVPGKVLRVVYKTPDGKSAELPPCTTFEILHVDCDGEPLMPNLLPAAPVTKVE